MKRTPLKRTAMKRKPKAPPTWQEQAHVDRVRGLACCIANNHCQGIVHAHHLTGGKSQNRKNSDFQTIPLCQNHHQDGGLGIALHAGVMTWEANHGTQEHWLNVTRLVLAKTSPEWCVFTGDEVYLTDLVEGTDQVARILDTITSKP